jgi:cell division protein FtsW
MDPNRNNKNKRERFHSYYDYSLLFIIIFMVGFGLVMLYSTSSYNAQVKFNNPNYYVTKQAFASALGFVVMLIVSRIDYHFWEHFVIPAYLLSIVLIVLVYLTGESYNGSQRWLRLGPLSFQPSEFVKVAMILVFAYLVSRVSVKKMSKLSTVFLLVLLAVPPVALVAGTNLSTAIIIMGIVIMMIFVASPKYMQFILMGGIAVVFMGAFLFLESYRLDRLKVWLHPEDYDNGFQTMQALYAIGSGDIFGKGLGKSIQKLGFVPEAQNDMIFSIICEELGLFGALAVLFLFFLMIWRFMVIANNAPDLFGSLIVVGAMAHIALQVLLNVAVVTNTIPNTGITLPFISYGGTSVSFLLAEMGLVLAVSRRIRLEK